MTQDASALGTDRGVLVIDDEQSIRFTLCEALRDEGYSPHAAATGDEAMVVLRDHRIDLALLDLRLQASGENGLDLLRKIKQDYPGVEVVMMTAHGRFDDALEAGKAGCYRFLAKPFELDQIKLVVQGALESAALRREVEVLRRQNTSRYASDAVVGESAVFREVLTTVRRVAGHPSTVLLIGETGSGKEVIARALHRASHVAGGPLVEVNCSAVPETLLESELFGHEKGAFTDAKGQKKGVFELADQGTLFLDEIGDMAPNLQSKLLRVLETGSFKRVGGTADIAVRVRVVAATNRDLKRAIAEGGFREDLYFRLAVVTLRIPPLRERHEDILALARHFLDQFNREMRTAVEGFEPGAEKALTAYSWPGNVRELRNVVERGVLLASGKRIGTEGLPPEVREGAPPPASSGAPRTPGEGARSLADWERMAIETALEECGGNKTRAAEFLGIARGTLRTKIREYGLDDG
jgi:DNA-binding NtrC family response regulator